MLKVTQNIKTKYIRMINKNWRHSFSDGEELPLTEDFVMEEILLLEYGLAVRIHNIQAPDKS